MKKIFLLTVAAAAIAACSNNDLVSESTDVRTSRQVPIGFSVEKQNITRSANLETVKHYNFGVWAWKVKATSSASVTADQEVMNHYLVGYSDNSSKGYYYDSDKTTTWASEPGTAVDHKSPWFYEGLGTSEYAYTGDAGFYTTTDNATKHYAYADYKSVNVNQWLRYWDLAYEKTNFYCYAPYNANVTFSHVEDGTSTMTFGATNTIRDGYDEPLNSDYNAYSRTLGEFMYAGVQANNEDLSDVTVPFKHMGAQVFIRFYENIPGYKVEIIDLGADKASAPTTDIMKGIQATPATAPTSGTTYDNGTYYTTSGATVTFAETTAEATYTPSWGGSTTVTNTTPLMFKIPQTGAYETSSVAPGNLSSFTPVTGGATYNRIPEDGEQSPQLYAYSPTIYYPVAQPTGQKTGFTFHVSYRIIAEDNGEVITVHNATVHVPYKTGGTLITVWQPNVKYTYTFKITKNSTGTTKPATDIDPTNPTPSTTKSLYPIVFDAATIEDYTTNYSEYTVSESTTY